MVKSWETMACIWVLDGVDRGWDRSRDESRVVALELSEMVDESPMSGEGHVRRSEDGGWLAEAEDVDGSLAKVWVEDWLSVADGREDWLVGDSEGVCIPVADGVEGLLGEVGVEVEVEVGLIDC